MTTETPRNAVQEETHEHTHAEHPGDGETPQPAARGQTPTGRLPAWLLVFMLGPVFVIGCILVVLAGSRSGAGNAGAEPPLPHIRTVPPFALTERSGRTVTDAGLRGSVWIADFFFTSCAGPCPVLSRRMAGLQRALRDRADRVKLVSITVDPETDTPPVLRAYAQRYGAEPDRWWFLTSDDPEGLRRLVREGFLSTVQPGSGGQVLHSTHLMIIDASGRIRALHDGMSSDSASRILHDVERILAEPAESPGDAPTEP